MSLYKPNRRREEIKLFAQTILQMTQERKVQTCFATRCEQDKGGRTHPNLRDVLHVQTRAAMRLGRRDA